MTKWTVFFLLIVGPMLLTAGCAGGGDGGGGGAAGSCQDYSDTDVECLDYLGSDWDATTAGIHCNGMGGTYSGQDCTTDARVGRCTLNQGTGMDYAHNYYEADRVQEAQQACTANNGVWSAS